MKSKIGIIGCGAMGSFLAIKLKIAGYDPIIFIKDVNRCKQKITLIENKKLYTENFTIGRNELNKKFDFIIIAVKSYDIETILNEYQNIINESKRIILIQSNIHLSEYNWNSNINKVYFAPMMIGVLGGYRSFVKRLNEGEIIIGKANNYSKDETNLVMDLFSKIAKTKLSINIKFDLFKKVILNTSLFSISLLSNCSFSEAYYLNKQNSEIADNIFYECICIAKSIYSNSKLYIDGVSLDNFNIEDAKKYIQGKINEYSEIYPSVYFDLVRENHNNELEYFYTNIIDLALKYKIVIPYLRKSFDDIKAYYTYK